ncbi:MAG: D-glycero-beta-D-manno-heptose 1-phosphate adenylyltransferase [Bacteroidetes bacterium HGW-Bacteroidetes-17]|jgi:rfaE bifunctional protein nucleotidyltransferase chain/domain|nr:MAG: D-glycero-beta-D-manno-heptose 1-phosphate adenylyltransferase [Bacteroidetes bacterium HGW-Bacteroidetes-17]
MQKTEIIQNKIYSVEALKSQLNIWRFKDKKIVFTNGCFDLLHLGHIDYLSKAADFGDIMIIGLNSDKSVTNIKGSNRPITDEKSRSAILASLFFVDAIILFDEATPRNLIEIIQPDVLIKGSDYTAENIIGYDIVKDKGGQIITLDFLPGYSTTIIENKIKGL